MYTIFKNDTSIILSDKINMKDAKRHGVWDLPKGKIEIEESKEDAGLREVKEECGFTSLTINGFVGTTYHLYEEKNYEVLKVSYWYDMYSDERELTPQLEEGITELKWVGVSDLKIILENTYPNISLLLDMYQSAIQ